MSYAVASEEGGKLFNEKALAIHKVVVDVVSATETASSPNHTELFFSLCSSRRFSGHGLTHYMNFHSGRQQASPKVSANVIHLASQAKAWLETFDSHESFDITCHAAVQPRIVYQQEMLTICL